MQYINKNNIYNIKCILKLINNQGNHQSNLDTDQYADKMN